MSERACVIGCSGYGETEVLSAVQRIFSDLNISREEFFDKKVLLKVNLVSPLAVDKAGTTHPAVVKAIINEINKFNPKSVVIGDSPGGPYTKGYLNQVYSATGMKKISEETGAVLNADFSYSTVEISGGVATRSLEIINAYLEADVVINIAKLKTHTLTAFTGATKNFYGLIPGLIKAQLHGANPDILKFSDLLIDIQEYAKNKAVLHVIDGVVGMEGDGPTAGAPRDVGVLIGSRSCYSADLAAVKIIDLDYQTVPYLLRAEARGLLRKDAQILGDGVEKFIIYDYKKVKLKLSVFPVIRSLPMWLQRYVNKHITRYPKIPASKCKACKKCFEHCPPKAISMDKGYAKINYDKCIRCFCCQELCPFHIIKVKKPLLYRISKR